MACPSLSWMLPRSRCKLQPRKSRLELVYSRGSDVRNELISAAHHFLDVRQKRRRSKSGGSFCPRLIHLHASNTSNKIQILITHLRQAHQSVGTYPVLSFRNPRLLGPSFFFSCRIVSYQPHSPTPRNPRLPVPIGIS